jgi:hypothetical protein
VLRRLFWCGGIVAAVAVILVAASAQKADLIIKRDLAVWDRPGDQAHRVRIGTLQAGTIVPVLKCLDIKVFFVYEVRASDGLVGYVEPPSAQLKVRSVFSAPVRQSMVWNCPG